MKIPTFLKLVYRALWLKDEWSKYFLAEKLSSAIYPKYRFSEFGRIYLEDEQFLQDYLRFDRVNFHSFDRKYFLRELVKMIVPLNSDTAECGVFHGASSYLICSVMQGQPGRKHHLFDSFEGLSQPESGDGNYWSKGDLNVDIDTVKSNLSEFNFVEYHKGWIPDTFAEAKQTNFSFVHIDVDLYQPTYDSVAFFYDRMVKGGVILCDDYGFTSCHGATRAFDEFFSDKPECIVNVPTGQAFVIKG